MDEVVWGPGARRGPDDSPDRSRSAALLSRLGGVRRSNLRRLSAALLSCGFVAIAAAQVLPWAHIGVAGLDNPTVTIDRSGVSREIGIADSQAILQLSYFITAAMMLALCGGAIFASRRLRTLMVGTALGAIGGHVLLLLPIVKTPARLYGFNLDNFGDSGTTSLKVMRDSGMWLGLAATVMLAVAVLFGLLTDRRPAVATGPDDPDGSPDGERLSDHDRPSTQYGLVTEVTAIDVRRAAAPSRTPSNQFAFEGHADLPVEVEAPARPDHSMYQRPRQDTDLGAR